MTFSIELQPHEVEIIETALISLGGKYNAKAKETDNLSAKLWKAKADQVFHMVCNLPSIANKECCDEIAAHNIEVSKIAWGDWLA